MSIVKHLLRKSRPAVKTQYANWELVKPWLTPERSLAIRHVSFAARIHDSAELAEGSTGE